MMSAALISLINPALSFRAMMAYAVSMAAFPVAAIVSFTSVLMFGPDACATPQ
jgi:hypothetical protein